MRPAPQHPDATPDPHEMPVCDRDGCRQAATVRQGTGGLCSVHWLALWGVRNWREPSGTNWST